MPVEASSHSTRFVPAGFPSSQAAGRAERERRDRWVAFGVVAALALVARLASGRAFWLGDEPFRSLDEEIRRAQRALERELERFGLTPRDVGRRPGLIGKKTTGRNPFWGRHYERKRETDVPGRVRRAMQDPDVVRAAEELAKWLRRAGRLGGPNPPPLDPSGRAARRIVDEHDRAEREREQRERREREEREERERRERDRRDRDRRDREDRDRRDRDRRDRDRF